MARFKVKTTGGAKLRAYVRKQQGLMRELKGAEIEIGFLDERIANLAASHEFGLRDRDGKQTLPERPAFRASRADVVRDWRRDSRKLARRMVRPRGRRVDVSGELADMAERAVENVRGSYRRFRGAPLSRMQRARKRGTPGHGRQLVGHRGERLIGHIKWKRTR